MVNEAVVVVALVVVEFTAIKVLSELEAVTVRLVVARAVVVALVVVELPTYKEVIVEDPFENIPVKNPTIVVVET